MPSGNSIVYVPVFMVLTVGRRLALLDVTRITRIIQIEPVGNGVGANIAST